MAFPTKMYFSLSEVSARWHRQTKDVEYCIEKPLFTSIMPLFKMLDHYERSELKASVVNAMIAAFIETPMDSESIAEMFGESVDDYLEKRKDWSVKLEGGSIIPVFPGDKVSAFTPSRPNSSYAAFVENVLRHIGTGLNIPLELLMKDFSKTNYSSARAALIEAWRFFNGRRSWIINYWAMRFEAAEKYKPHFTD